MVTQIPGAIPAVAGLAGAATCPAGEERVVLRDGSVAVIRPLVAGDVAAITAWFEGLGEETRYARFLAGVKRLDDRTRSQLAQVDHWDHEALTAVMTDGAIAGISRYIRLPESRTAEVAVAVTDRWRGRGIASLLLRRIAARAQAAGICCLTAQCLSSNTAILRLLSRLGTMTTILAGPGVVEIWIDLPPVSTISPR
jgi:RimJ/RimL family protein N-acetyltransferase